MSDVHLTTIRAWVAGVCGLHPIPYAPDKPRPPLPYLMANLTGVAPLADHAHRYIEGETSRVIADIELRVSLHAYGPDPLALLRPLIGVRDVPQALAPLGAIRLHRVGLAEYVPELVGTAYEPRAHQRLVFHAPDVSDHATPSIEDAPIDVRSDL